MRVLIVDDEPFSRTLLAHALAHAGHEVLEAENGTDALRTLAGTNVNVVISDWEMPEMDGLDLCRAIRSGTLDRYVYTILLTARAGSGDFVTGLSAGADDFLTKPFDPAELAVRLKAAERILSLETRDLAIFAMAKLAESRDHETGAHLERVREYCRLLAQRLAAHPPAPVYAREIDAEFVRLIFLTSPLHDIGKVGIPDCVLLKPGRLNDEEFAVMKTHALLGASTLDAALDHYPGAKFLRMARDIAATHHEEFNGKGYPAGLAGQDIPLSGRITSLADVYDALRSKRVYKSASTHTTARGVILEGAGEKFDPAVVDAFLAVEPEFQRVVADHAEESPRLAA